MPMRFFLWALLLLAPLPLAAQAVDDRPAADDPATRLVRAERDVRTVDRALDARVDDDTRDTLRERIIAARVAATAATGDLAAQLALVDARLAGLGPASAAEAADLRLQRQRLARQHTVLDSGVKRGRLIGVEAQQLADELDQSVAERFSQTIAARSPSPISPAFWIAVVQALPRDVRRTEGYVATGIDAITRAGSGGVPWSALLGLVAALAIAGPARLAALRFGQRFLIEDAPGHRVRRSAAALWRVMVGTLAPFVAIALLTAGLRWARLLPGGWDTLAEALTVATTYACFASAVVAALLMRSQPSWRVAPIADDVAVELRPYGWLLAGVAFISYMLEAFSTAVGISPAAQSATHVLEIILHLALLAGALLALGRLRANRAEEESAAPARTGLGAVALLAWVLAIATLFALLLGFLGFALFVMQLIGWGLVLASATYLLMAAVDDMAVTLFARDSTLGRALSRGLGLRGAVIDQFGVLLSGVARLTLALVALGLFFVPFGAGGGIGTFLARLGLLAQGVQVGGIAVSPGAIVRGLAVLFVGLALVRGFRRWLEDKYLPATDLDGSARNSVGLVARYVGVALAVIWALASLGIGVERIALLLSALSVGIGFGLQAITSNFVSGLILLAERPIKIGDWIRVGTDEGDVKRISVRSTEIALADHSTLIVPNSELITKSVLNKTLSGPLGRLQIQFSVPLEADADRVVAIVADAFVAEAAVIDDPKPTVFIDSIADGRIFFNCFAHVASPRAAYSARSAILTVLLRRFRAAGIDIGSVPQRMELIGRLSEQP
jgi:small-conductance mechanosensitive channel